MQDFEDKQETEKSAEKQKLCPFMGFVLLWFFFAVFCITLTLVALGIYRLLGG